MSSEKVMLSSRRLSRKRTTDSTNASGRYSKNSLLTSTSTKKHSYRYPTTYSVQYQTRLPNCKGQRIRAQVQVYPSVQKSRGVTPGIGSTAQGEGKLNTSPSFLGTLESKRDITPILRNGATSKRKYHS